MNYIKYTWRGDQGRHVSRPEKMLARDSLIKTVYSWKEVRMTRFLISERRVPVGRLQRGVLIRISKIKLCISQGIALVRLKKEKKNLIVG